MSYKLDEQGKPIPSNPDYVRMLSKNLRVTIYFQNNTGVPQALQKMQETTGMTPGEYIKKRIIGILEDEGYYTPPCPMDNK